MFENLNWSSTSKLDVDKLNKMVANDNYLYQNMISGYYDVMGVVRDSGLSLRTGYAKIVNQEQQWQTMIINYARPFLPGTRPVVVTGLATDAYGEVFHAAKNLGGQAIPDHRGILLRCIAIRDPGGPSRFAGEQWCSYLAIGPNG